MAKATMEHYEEMPVLPDNSIIYLKVDALAIKQVDGARGAWEKAEFTFKMLGVQTLGDDSDPDLYDVLIGQKIWGSIPFRFSDNPENKLKQWTEALLGLELEAGFELDTDILLRREARGITSHYEKRTIDVRTGRPFRNHQVESLLPKAGQVLSQQSFVAPTPAADPWSVPQPAAQPPQSMVTVPPGVGDLYDEPPFFTSPLFDEFGTRLH